MATFLKINSRLPVSVLIFFSVFTLFGSCKGKQTNTSNLSSAEKTATPGYDEIPEKIQPIEVLLVFPQNPLPGENFRIVATGGKNIQKAKIVVSGGSGNLKILKSRTGKESPFWRVDDFEGGKEGKYKATLLINGEEKKILEFEISPPGTSVGKPWKINRGWDPETETIYSAWINALFEDCGEQSSWPSLNELTENRDKNFLYNILSLDEDNPDNKNKVIMEPDCADNPFFLRAYFAWKLGLPFGYHICDRGYLGRNPGTGQWVTNENLTSKSNPVQSFNQFLRRIMDGVHSGTARTALDNETSDYYPVALKTESLRPGTVFADPYGHTLVLVSWQPQTKNNPGTLLAVDAQPDKTIAIKRFWKGNFLFNTSEVVGEPGFKAFRPIIFENGKLKLLKNEELTGSSGFSPFSLEQRKMESGNFYHTMERLINPEPLEPEEALNDLIKALHEQLLVRVKSVANGEEYMKSHPGTVIPMPSNANGIFQAGGLWEDFSTPNRDLRLLIAMDAVTGFPDYVSKYPGDFKVSKSRSSEEIKEKLQKLLEQKVSELSISYTGTGGLEQVLTLAEILKRKDAFEMAYNPNDCVEIRWGAPENSIERSACKRHAPQNQQATMQKVRKWFSSRLHPPT